jgi:hypothetical protein
MATGNDAERRDLRRPLPASACGLWPDFGLGAEDSAAAGVKRAMAQASERAAVVASDANLIRCGRRLVLDEVYGIVTNALSGALAPFPDAEVEVIHV